jgi:hypothetical protein
MVGTPYTNNPISLTDEELKKLPTIILQFKGDAPSNKDIVTLSGNSIPLARDLDPDNPYDVLLAVPPSHYMEYQRGQDVYVPGFYFDEPDGSVLGANVMMLHDIFFDVERYRIGWSESSCDYSKLVAPFVATEKLTIDASPREPHRGQNLRVHRHAEKQHGTHLTAAAAKFAILDLSSRVVQPGLCSSATCQIGVVIGVLLGLLAALVAVAAVKTKPVRRGVVRQPTNLQRLPAANYACSTGVRRSMSGSDHDISTLVRGKDFTKGVILRSRSNQIVV